MWNYLFSDFFGIDFQDMDEPMVLVEDEKEGQQVWVNRFQLVD